MSGLKFIVCTKTHQTKLMVVVVGHGRDFLCAGQLADQFLGLVNQRGQALGAYPGLLTGVT
jgi:hypothetical protein